MPEWGRSGQFTITFPILKQSAEGLGFTAIIVAWLAKLNPGFVIISGFFFAGIIVGGDAIQISMGLPAATVNVFNGLILMFLITGDFFSRNRVMIQRRSA